MSKNKNTGLLIALGAVLGAAAAGISYYLKYKSYNDKIENEDFHDYEEDDTEESDFNEPLSFNESNRTYITIDGGKGKSEDAAETANDSAVTNHAEIANDTELTGDAEFVNDAETNTNDETAEEAASANDAETANIIATANDAETANNAETSAKHAAPTPSAATVEEDTEGVN